MTRQEDLAILRATLLNEWKTGYAEGSFNALTSCAKALDTAGYGEAARMAREFRDVAAKAGHPRDA